MKHILEQIQPFREILDKCNSKLMKAYSNVKKLKLIIYFNFLWFKKALNDERFESIYASIRSIIEDEAKYQKGLLNIQIQKCFAIKVNWMKSIN